VLGCAPFDERHNSANIAEWMTRELDNWQLSTVTEMIISDTAANQLGIFNPELVPDLPRHFKPSKCCCHLLQLCIGDCIFSRPNITRIVKDCRSICTHASLSIHLTPPPSSTNVERLFSYGGLVATDHRSSLSGEKLDQILFLRENALMANFDLGWN